MVCISHLELRCLQQLFLGPLMLLAMVNELRRPTILSRLLVKGCRFVELLIWLLVLQGMILFRL